MGDRRTRNMHMHMLHTCHVVTRRRAWAFGAGHGRRSIPLDDLIGQRNQHHAVAQVEVPKLDERSYCRRQVARLSSCEHELLEMYPIERAD